ncbi:MAG TPA: class I SAM-dependent methyltransferase [Thermoanaerobaculia bacterium]|nr:class I SAM-dependent methyltransferase [Thermoanaerobaculia bacterium]
MSRQGQKRDNTYENIRQFWDAEAKEIGRTPQVTIRDHFFRIHELQTLLTIIPRTRKLLDIGCGTGFGTVILARRAEQAVGGDYSDVMIRWAHRLLADAEYRDEIATRLSPLWPMGEHGAIEFHTANIVDLQIPHSDFDVITGQRILINLPNHEEHLRALDNLRSVATPGATLILVEATRQGHAATDAYRSGMGVPPLEKYWHNCYVDESRYHDWPAHGWKVSETLSFDTYMLLSKVVYPAAVGPENCAFLSGANQAAMEIACMFRTRASAAEAGGDAGLLRMWVDRVALYDAREAETIGRWIAEHGAGLADWSRLGHQRLILARAEG